MQIKIENRRVEISDLSKHDARRIAAALSDRAQQYAEAVDDSNVDIVESRKIMFDSESEFLDETAKLIMEGVQDTKS